MWVKPLWVAGIAIALVLLSAGNGLAETREDAEGSGDEGDEGDEGGCIHLHHDWPFILVHPSYCKDMVEDLITPEHRF